MAAGIALGTEEFIHQVRNRVKGLGHAPESTYPSLRELRRLGKATPEEVEEALETVFADERYRRRQVIRMYALVVHSGLRHAEVALRRIRELSLQDEGLAQGLSKLARLLNNQRNGL